MMGRILDHFSLKTSMEVGGDIVRARQNMRPFMVSHQAARSRDAALAAGIPADDIECVGDFMIAHQLGARDALRFAQVVLSDPQTKGREVEVLKLLEKGCDHAEIRAALRAPPADAPRDGGSSVVAFQRPSKPDASGVR